jgi:hypothetical protein
MRQRVLVADAPHRLVTAMDLPQGVSYLEVTIEQQEGHSVLRLVLENGMTLTGTVLRNTSSETLWSWDEIESVMEIKAFRGPHWGSNVGIRISSWMEDAAELADLDGWLPTVVGKLTSVLTQAAS